MNMNELPSSISFQMEEEDLEDLSSQPFFVRAEFPFVFIPTTTGFTFTNSHTHVIDGNDQTTTEFLNEKETNEEGEETVNDKVDDNDESDEGKRVEDTNDLRISQPKYSQLLKDLDFSQTRMVDVTNLLSDDPGNYLTPDENENQKKLSGDEKYQSLSSARSSISTDEDIAPQSSSNLEKNNENLINAANDIQNDLNDLAAIIQEASQQPSEEYDNENNIILDPQKKQSLEEDDDTSKQATQNYDLHDNEQEDIATTSKSNKNLRFTTQHSASTQDDNISSIPRLNTSINHRTENSQESPSTWDNLINGTDAFIPSPSVLIYSQPIDTTPPIKEQQSLEKPKQHLDSSPRQKAHHRVRQISTSSDTDSVADYAVHGLKQKQHSTSQPQSLVDDDLNDLNTHLQQVLNDQDRPYTTASEVLIRRLSNQPTDRTSSNKKKTHHRSSTTNETWLSMLEKLEHEHKERLEKQQKQYEDYMHKLEEKMKQRFDDYLLSTNSLHQSKSETFDNPTHHSAPIDSNTERYRSYQYRPLAKDLTHHYHPTTQSLITSDKRQAIGTNLPRSQSREDISNLRTELSTKHAKHISDLKLYYEEEIAQLKNQLNRSRMGHTSSTTRQSIETIERINNENIQLHDEMKDLQHSLKITEEENHSLKRQIEDLRDQLNHKDVELKNYHRTMTDLEQQLNEAQNIKERQDEKFRHADRQALIHREENDRIAIELNLTRERLIRLEERYRELENESRIHRPQGFPSENNTQRIPEDLKFNSTMALNIPTSREYGRFTLTTSKYSASTVSTPRDGNLDSGRYTTNGSDDLFRREVSPRPLVKITDYINERPTFPQAYVPPSRPLYSPRKSPPNRRRLDQMPVRDYIDDQINQGEQLEEKFDELLRKKRDLESRLNRIPTRNLTNTDRQLLDTLEREIERVEQQISSVKLELRKMNILRAH